MKIRDYLAGEGAGLLFDGAMGTWYAAKNGRLAAACETANLRAPQEVLAIHREYLQEGANALKTNTFACNRVNYPEEECRRLLQAGWQLAQTAALGAKDPDRTFVFADIGPVSISSGADPAEEYRFLADCFLVLGADHFLFETNTTEDGLRETAAHIKEKKPEAFILVSFAVLPDGFTAAGLMAPSLLRRMAEDPNIDAVGMNCVTGARHMVQLAESVGIHRLNKPLSIMPNAGYPTVIGSRTVYEGTPDYFAGQLRTLWDSGVRILGGCCGTTPEHIAAVSRALAAPAPEKIRVGDTGRQTEARKSETATRGESPFWQALCDPAQKPFAVELDPPEAADVTRFMTGVRELKAGGASIVTIADCPIARARMDSSLLACKVKRELDVEALPHMTCRDRNINATKALLLGLCAEEIGNVLVVTGDPIPTASRDEIKSVFNFNSRNLANFITGLGETVLPVPFHVFGALNVNVRNFQSQLKLAELKLENGVQGFLTQPVLTEEGFENLKLARQVLGDRAKLLGGIIPIVSRRNALFMNSEVSGISVDAQIIDLYEGADRARGEELAEEISCEVAARIAPYIDGYYLITPFGRTALMARIMQRIRQQG